MKFYGFTLLLIFIVFTGNAQSKIDNYELGTYFDLNSQIIEEYYDFDYSPVKAIEINHNIGDLYTPGCYYDLNGKKISGRLLFSLLEMDFRFKENRDAVAEYITPDECNGYVIGLDSFTVIKNFYVERELLHIQSNTREFAEVIDQFDDLCFYKHTRLGAKDNVITYLYKADSSINLISFPKKKEKFKEIALTVFGESEILKSQILEDEYSSDDIPQLIKFLKYKRLSDTKGKMYFSSSWDEMAHEKGSSYYALVNSVNDTIFNFKYFFKNDIPIYEGSYSSFYPRTRTGQFKWYYPNGDIRKTIEYINNKPKITLTFFPNGKIHYAYKIINDTVKYNMVYDINGNPILNSSGSGSEELTDTFTGERILNKFKFHKLVSSSYESSNGNKIYRLCEVNSVLKKIASYKCDYPVSSLKDYSHGVVLLRCIVEPTGLVSDISILRGVDAVCDSIALDFLAESKVEKKFKPGRSNREKVTQEIIVPVNFSITGFSRYRNYYYHNYYFQQQMMMQQSTPITNYKPMPYAPRSF